MTDASSHGLRAHLLGVRGSTPAPGHDFAGVGGHTSCVAIEPASWATSRGGRWLVLDAGTGFRGLGGLLGDAPLQADVVLTHLHWDHVQGLPFLPNADRDGAEVDLWIPAAAEVSDARALELLTRGFGPPSFPIRPDQLRGDWHFRALPSRPLELAGTSVVPVEVHHKGGRTLGLRVERGGRSLAYLPDHSAARADERQRCRALGLLRDADVALHDAQFLESERAIADDFGHCTVGDAVELAHCAGVSRLVLVHHSPSRTDDDVVAVLDEAMAKVSELEATMTVELGREGDVLVV